LEKLQREEIMKNNARSFLLTAAAIAAGGLVMGTEASAESVKIGILNDQSGVYADFGGQGSIVYRQLIAFTAHICAACASVMAIDREQPPLLAVEARARVIAEVDDLGVEPLDPLDVGVSAGVERQADCLLAKGHVCSSSVQGTKPCA
jgi:hypothetical protein